LSAQGKTRSSVARLRERTRNGIPACSGYFLNIMEIASSTHAPLAWLEQAAPGAACGRWGKVLKY